MTKRLTLSTKNSIHLVDSDDILFCKCNNSSTSFFLQNSASIIVSKGIHEIELLLQGADFIRPHQSFLVNRKHVVRIDKLNDYTLVLSNNEHIPVSVRRRKHIVEIFKQGL